MKIRMVSRRQCPYCNKRLAGEGHLQRHIRAVHKSESSKK